MGLVASIVLLLVSLYGKYQKETQPKAEYVRIVEVNNGETITGDVIRFINTRKNGNYNHSKLFCYFSPE